MSKTRFLAAVAIATLGHPAAGAVIQVSDSVSVFGGGFGFFDDSDEFLFLDDYSSDGTLPNAAVVSLTLALDGFVSGFGPLSFEDGFDPEEAQPLDWFGSVGADVVTMDLALPGLSGLSVLGDGGGTEGIDEASNAVLNDTATFEFTATGADLVQFTDGVGSLIGFDYLASLDDDGFGGPSSGYAEGEYRIELTASITYYDGDDVPPPPIPLPAGGILLVSALGLLSLGRRRR